MRKLFLIFIFIIVIPLNLYSKDCIPTPSDELFDQTLTQTCKDSVTMEIDYQGYVIIKFQCNLQPINGLVMKIYYGSNWQYLSRTYSENLTVLKSVRELSLNGVSKISLIFSRTFCEARGLYTKDFDISYPRCKFVRNSSDYSYNSSTQKISGKLLCPKNESEEKFLARVEFYRSEYDHQSLIFKVEPIEIKRGQKIDEVLVSGQTYERFRFEYQIDYMPFDAVFIGFYRFGRDGDLFSGTDKIRLRKTLDYEYPTCRGNLIFDPTDGMCYCSDREMMETVYDEENDFAYCYCKAGYVEEGGLCKLKCSDNSSEVNGECVCSEGFVEDVLGKCIDKNSLCEKPNYRDINGDCVLLTSDSKSGTTDTNNLELNYKLLNESEKGCSLSMNSNNGFVIVAFFAILLFFRKYDRN